MPDGIQHRAIGEAVKRYLSSLRKWWRQWDEFAGLDAREIERIGAELGLTVPDLRTLAARGWDAGELLYRRMKLLGIGRGDVEHAALGLLRDLERTCSRCGHKPECAQDLAVHRESKAWPESKA
jgi:hypothetical protein